MVHFSIFDVQFRLIRQIAECVLCSRLAMKGYTSSKLKKVLSRKRKLDSVMELDSTQEASTNSYNRQEPAARNEFQERVKSGQLPGPIPLMKQATNYCCGFDTQSFICT